MHTKSLEDWSHDHSMGQGRVTRGERRTLVVALLTAVFMVVEVTAGVLYGSMALLADGLHMGSHAVALGVAVAAYVYARRRAGDRRFSFGTGKVNALGGYSGALLLAGFAVVMAWESVERFLAPVPIVFDHAIAVAVVGLIVNGISVVLLGVHGHHDDHDHHDDAEPRPEREPVANPGHGHHHHHDHNLRSAYLHVLADAFTSVAAIVALLGGKLFGLVWLDPVMGVVGSVLVAWWAWGLLRQSSAVLLDHQAPTEVLANAREALEVDEHDRVADLHIWTIAPGVRAACATVVSHAPRSPAEYRARLPAELHVGHATIEVHQCPGEAAVEASPTAG